MSGVSFLPHSDHVYQQAPYQECTKDEYDDMLSKMNTRINWSKLREYEKVILHQEVRQWLVVVTHVKL